MLLSNLQLCSLILAGVSGALARPTIQWRRQVSNSTSSAIAVTGATQGGMAPRLEIHDLMQDADQWNIYLLALQSFQAMNPSDPLSWYQIGGIHGQPFIPYNGIPQCDGCDPQGYCAHSSTLFPTWHRAYVALFEQSLQANALAVANQFPESDKARYLTAAQSLRSPFFDWALGVPRGEQAFPDFFTAPTVDVNTPTGTQTIPNPLASFSFGSADHSFASADATFRAPKMSKATRQQSRSDLWTLLTSQSNYNEMSTRALNKQRDNPSSLEAIHDTIHVDIGGSMENPETAGFDPVFWLHHTMVDRVFALYQAAWPEEWLESTDVVGDTFTYVSGSVQDANSVLEPFGLTSDAARDTSSFNYYYADLNSGAAPIDIINDLYGDFDSPSAAPPAATPPSKRSTIQTTSNITHEYVANVRVDLPGSAGSFDVFVFDGAPDTRNPQNWFEDSDFLGQHGFFTDANVRGAHDKLSHASVSLTAALRRRVARGEIEDLEPETVARHLRDTMQWRVVDRFNKLVPNREIPMLQVNVVTAELEMPTQRGVMPKWSPFTQLVGCEGDLGAWINGWCSNVD